MNMRALKNGQLQRIHAGIGILLAVFLWIAVFAALIKSEQLDQIAAGAGALLAPVWYIWLGIRFTRNSSRWAHS